MSEIKVVKEVINEGKAVDQAVKSDDKIVIDSIFGGHSNTDSIKNIFSRYKNEGVVLNKFDDQTDVSLTNTTQDIMLKHPIDNDILKNSFFLNATHSVCLRITSTMISGFGYYFKKKLPKKVKEIIDRPNNEIDESFSDILNNIATDYKKRNEFAIGIKMTSSGKIIIKYCDTSAIRIVPYKSVVSTSKKVKYYYEVQVDNLGVTDGDISSIARKYIPLRWDTQIKPNVWYLARYYKKNDLSLMFGVPDYLPALMPIAENKKIYEYNNVFFDNNARPDFILVVKGVQNLPKSHKENIKNFITTNYKGSTNAHRTLYLEFDDEKVEVELIPVSKDLKDDASFRLLKIDNRDDIARAWNVPPKVIGISSAGSLGSGSEALGALKLLKEYTKIDQNVIEIFISNVIEKITGEKVRLKFRKIELTNEKDKAVIFNLIAGLRDNNGKPILPYSNVMDDLDLEVSEDEGRFVVAYEKNVDVNSQGKPIGDNLDEEVKDDMNETDTEYI